MSNILKSFAEAFEKECCSYYDVENKSFAMDYTLIGKFLSEYCELSAINEQLSDNYNENLSDNRRWFLTLFMMKITLDMDTLQRLCLMPPSGVGLEQWQCFMGHCNSTTRSLRIQNSELVENLRKMIAREDVLHIDEDFYKKYREVWGNVKRTKSKNENEGLGSNSPLILFPVKYLNGRVRDTILRERPELTETVDQLFLCCEHLQPKEKLKNGRKEKSKFRRCYYSYSLEHINKSLESGDCVFTLGQKKNYTFYNHLLEKCNLKEINFEYEFFGNPDQDELQDYVQARIMDAKTFLHEFMQGYNTELQKQPKPM